MNRIILRIKGEIIIMRMRKTDHIIRACIKAARRVNEKDNFELAKAYLKLARRYEKHFLDLASSVLEISRELH